MVKYCRARQDKCKNFVYKREIWTIYCGEKKSHKYTLVLVVLISRPKIWHTRCLREDRVVLSHRFREFSDWVAPPTEMRFMVMSTHRTRTRKQRAHPESSLAITFKSLSPVTYSTSQSPLHRGASTFIITVQPVEWLLKKCQQIRAKHQPHPFLWFLYSVFKCTQSSPDPGIPGDQGPWREV